MKVFTLKRVGVAAAIAILAGLGIVGVERNSTSIQIKDIQFDELRRDIALECLEGDMKYGRQQLMLDIFAQEMEDSGPVILSNFKSGDSIISLCQIMFER